MSRNPVSAAPGPVSLEQEQPPQWGLYFRQIRNDFQLELCNPATHPHLDDSYTRVDDNQYPWARSFEIVANTLIGCEEAAKATGLLLNINGFTLSDSEGRAYYPQSGSWLYLTETKVLINEPTLGKVETSITGCVSSASHTRFGIAISSLSTSKAVQREAFMWIEQPADREPIGQKQVTWLGIDGKFYTVVLADYNITGSKLRGLEDLERSCPGTTYIREVSDNKTPGAIFANILNLLANPAARR